MSDKAIDDYDENHREILDTTSGSTNSYNRHYNTNYRSPLILRNEKPPAPPEYTKQFNIDKTQDHQQNTTTGILNELHMMLQQDIPRALTDNATTTTTTTTTPTTTPTTMTTPVDDESMALINKMNYNSPPTTPQFSSNQKNRIFFQTSSTPTPRSIHPI